jgi:hypothetical protein
VRISLRARNFFCEDERCTRRIFTEPLPGTASRYARRSCRSSDALSWITLALGSVARNASAALTIFGVGLCAETSGEMERSTALTMARTVFIGHP